MYVMILWCFCCTIALLNDEMTRHRNFISKVYVGFVFPYPNLYSDMIVKAGAIAHLAFPHTVRCRIEWEMIKAK